MPNDKIYVVVFNHKKMINLTVFKFPEEQDLATKEFDKYFGVKGFDCRMMTKDRFFNVFIDPIALTEFTEEVISCLYEDYDQIMAHECEVIEYYRDGMTPKEAAKAYFENKLKIKEL